MMLSSSRIAYLRRESEAGRLDLTELSEIEAAFAELDPATLSDLPENAMVSDMLDELERVMSRELADALAELQEEFPDVLFAYWGREEFDERHYPGPEDEEPTPLTDEQWLMLRDDAPDAIYDAVSRGEVLWALAEHVSDGED